ncbi:MAG TPA: TauD/TfdA family dioxygenase [Pyrinomonadaceae bacterium]|nr:TauD/TfdA family dioxygenase [Pyrinomonadaceae bacterium]
MSSTAVAATARFEYTLNELERSVLADACSAFTRAKTQDALVTATQGAAPNLAKDLPSLVQRLQGCVDESSSPGLVLLQNVPEVADPRSLGLLIGWLLGDVTKYAGEGDYVIEIRDQGTKAGERPSFKNARDFFLHTDLSYVPEPPRFFLLHSIANDTASGGISEFCRISEALDEMDNLAIKQLEKSDYEFPAPPHYKDGARVVRFPILTRETDATPLRIRFRRDNLRTVYRDGIDAVMSLVSALRTSVFEVGLPPNSVAVIDNWFLLHGRTAFAPQTTPRHINRIYVNPRKEPHNGRVY